MFRNVAWFESREDLAGAALLPEEEPLAADAGPKRRRELTAGRHCARRALEQLGVEPAPILAGRRGEPLWPGGIVGSITHCAGYVAAAVARADDVPALGIDAEPHRPLPSGIVAEITTPAERLRLATLPTGICWDRLLFSAKESLYKAWYPHHQRMLEFEDVEIDLRLDDTFLTSVPGFGGHWTLDRGILVTAVTGT